jgi:hypothetical protein
MNPHGSRAPIIVEIFAPFPLFLDNILALVVALRSG